MKISGLDEVRNLKIGEKYWVWRLRYNNRFKLIKLIPPSLGTLVSEDGEYFEIQKGKRFIRERIQPAIIRSMDISFIGDDMFEAVNEWNDLINKLLKMSIDEFEKKKSNLEKKIIKL